MQGRQLSSFRSIDLGACFKQEPQNLDMPLPGRVAQGCLAAAVQHIGASRLLQQHFEGQGIVIPCCQHDLFIVFQVGGGKSPTELGPPSPQPSPKFHHLESHRHHLPGRVFVWTCWRQFQLPRLASLPCQSFLQNLRGQTMQLSRPTLGNTPPWLVSLYLSGM